MNRQAMIQWASMGARDPSQASTIAKWIADALREEAKQGETHTPPGYLYQGAFEWVLSVSNIQVESLTTTPLTSSSNPYVPFRVPFDALIQSVHGWAEPVATPGESAVNQQFLAANLSTAEESRDLFSLSIGIDGQASFGTDGNNQLMFPASTVVGTRLHPRPMAWTVRRNQLIQAKFRNITNVPLDGVASNIMAPVILKNIYLVFTALNLGSP